MNDRNGKLSRRTFLKSAGVAAGAAIALPHFIPARALGLQSRAGANRRLNIAILGVGERGTVHLLDMIQRSSKGEVNLAAVCDVNNKRLEKAAQLVAPKTAKYTDYRYILQRKDIDAVIIATPDHWHAVQFVQAAQSGKHIYCETPACTTIAEGKAMIEAAQKAKIAALVGAQGRAQPESYLMHAYLANGSIGKVTQVTCWGEVGLVDEDPVADEDPPSDLDWDLWLGPLRRRSYNPRFSNGAFRWMMESGGGRICRQGAQIMSCAMLWLGADGTGPESVEAGGTWPTKGIWDAPVEMRVAYTFKNPDWTLTWNQPGDAVEPEQRTPDEPEIGKTSFGAKFQGEKGEVFCWCGDGGIWVERKARQIPQPGYTVQVPKSPGHIEDWFGGIRSGSKTIMNIEAGVGTANLCILGNLSFILGRKLQWDQAKSEIIDDEQARRLMNRPQRYPYYL
jgi:predicted dehydrogenase